MIRLFIRLYIGVLVILAVGWRIQSYTYRVRSAEDSVRVVEEAVGGGVRITREVLERAPLELRSQKLMELSARYDYPLRILCRDELPQGVLDRIDRGDDVIYFPVAGVRFLAPLSGGEEVLEFGPLRMLQGPSQLEVMTGLGGVLLVAAGAIALLLRPIFTQLHLVERTATAIAGGELSARVDERKVKSAGALARAFNSMADRVESLLRTQRELLQAVSHELRTPLSRIHFATDLIREAGDDQQREQRLNSLDSAADELDDLVGELLRYVRMESSESLVEIEELQLLPLVEEVIERQSLICPNIRFDLSEELQRGDIRLNADRTLLLRALGNLLANAGRFAASRVLVDAKRTTDGVRINVDDDGPGIPEEDRERVFEPFVSTDESGGGAGLGLALVRRVVAQHEGDVSAQTSPMGGARLQILWRQAEIPEPATSESGVDERVRISQ